MSIALFPGRFQPPHLGHVITAIRLYKDYERIIIAVTEAKPRIMPPAQVKRIFEEIFRYIPKYEVIIIRGKEWMNNMPKGIDVVITGNDDSVERLRKRNIRYHKVPRAEGIGFRGSDLRKLVGTKEEK